MTANQRKGRQRARAIFLEALRLCGSFDEIEPKLLFSVLIEMTVDVGVALSNEEQCVEAICRGINQIMINKHFKEP